MNDLMIVACQQDDLPAWAGVLLLGLILAFFGFVIWMALK